MFGRDSYASTDSVSNDVCRARLCLGKCMSSRIADCIDMSEDGEDGGDVLMLEFVDVGIEVENLIIVDGYLRFCNGEHIGGMTAHYVIVSHSRGI